MAVQRTKIAQATLHLISAEESSGILGKIADEILYDIGENPILLSVTEVANIREYLQLCKTKLGDGVTWGKEQKLARIEAVITISSYILTKKP